MSTAEHDRTLLGAYALGILDPDEQRIVSEHLSGCLDCQREVTELLQLRPALDEVPPEAFLDGPPDNDLLLQGALRRVRAEAAPAPPRRGWSPAAITATAAAAIAVVLAGGILIGRQTAPSNTVVAAPPPTLTTPAPGARSTVATNPVTGASMAVTVVPKSGWVWVNANVIGVPAGAKCELLVVPKNGQPQLAGAWKVSPQGAREGTMLQGTALVDPRDVAAIAVVTTDGQQMVSVPL